MKKIFKITFGVLLLLLVALYLGIVCVLPSIINSKTTINTLQSFIHNKTGIETKITGLNLKISPKLLVIFNVDSIDAKNNNASVADIKNFSLKYKLLQKQLTFVSADKIYLDGNYLKQFKGKNKKKDRSKSKFKGMPEIHIKNLAYKSDEISIYAQNIDTENDLILIKAAINTPFLKEALKIGESGSLQFAENKFRANKFRITLGNSKLYLDGIIADENKSSDLDIKGEKLPLSELMPALLRFQKSKDPSKKFIENFRNFKGTANVNLKLKDGIWGTCVVNNLGANAVWFDIPLYAKEVVFNFKGRTVDSVAEGIIGNEKVIHTLDVTKMGTPEKLVIGTLKSTLTPKFNSVPNLKVLNSVNFELIYKIKDRKPDVYYNIDIPVNSDLIYNSFYLGLRNYKRKIYANTFKDGNDLYLKQYKYSYSDSNKENVIISGDGLFSKYVDKSNPDKFIPQFVTCHTNGYAPISVTGSFGEKVRGGEFKGDLKYDFKNNQVLGTFDIIKARHQAFHIDQAHVVSQNGIFNVTSNGWFKGEKYSAELNLKNNIYGETLIYNMKLFLDKLILQTTPDTQKKKKKKINPHEITKQVRNADITINNWEIAINEIKRDKFVLQNVKLLGSMKNNIFDFKMQELNFADGTVNANGIYDFTKNTSKMTFEAQNINSNKVAEATLNLKNQIEGTANAKVNLDAKDMFKFIDANCAFEVKEGFMPKLGDTELMIQNSKYKLSQIINIDLSQKDLMKDDIKGKFDVHNTEIKNIDITTWHELSAMYLEGNYEMEKQLADLHLFWNYSKEAPKGIRIFGIPMKLILRVVFRPEHTKELYRQKLSKIPKINADEKNSNYYRIHLKGDINNNKTTLKLKEIR